MRLVRFTQNSERPRIGVLFDQRIVPLDEVLPEAPASVVELITQWDAIAPRLKHVAEARSIPLGDVTLLSPVDRPQKLLAIGLNYADHIEEAKSIGLQIPTEQVWFCKQPSALNGPFAGIEMPKVSDKLDYEVELVAVIGRGGRHISATDAPEHVFGYTIGNDVSVRDWQTRTPQWMLGKSFDTHAPVGPCIVTADEIGDPHRLAIRAYVNGELRQNSNVKHLVFKVWDQIAELSKAMTLQPGDLIFTGTPGGVGFGFNPPKYLSVGDIVRCEIEEIGAIENTVIAEP
ncbi:MULTISPECIES: fumarylacetoacetate hydrolase family protein [Haematobacter]|uniref:5-carboxymethyl-2-hydroxymuconate isomerase n=1 Tax=Haematobacter genomosp. 1 TaxID=366618 RepID=A0A212ADZ0_9RHOB|nr:MULTISPECIES: fumarylacetoacetate hydrolase family protein [Haematobacter]OWJ79399.1 5-carboxymethyl-2-hydroxymuconate isomerase [Haematobacter genomosp. 1]